MYFCGYFLILLSYVCHIVCVFSFSIIIVIIRMLLSESRLSAGGGGVVAYRITLIIEKEESCYPPLKYTIRSARA